MSKSRLMKKAAGRNVVDDADLQSMFHQMMGAEAPDPAVITPKYEDILRESKSIIEVLKRTFVNSAHLPEDLRSDFNAGFNDIRKFCENSMAELESLTLKKKEGITDPEDIKDMSEDQKNLQKILQSLQCGYDITELHESYKKLKEGSETIDSIIIARRDILKFVNEDKLDHKKEFSDIHDKAKLSDNFINKFSGDFLQLFPSISVLDFKQLWLHELCDYELKRRIIFALYLIIKKSDLIVKHIMTPDIDIATFSDVLVGHMDGLRKAIPRCDKAFNKIKQSVGMLKDNFGGYYKDFAESGNPALLIENFVLDVAEGSTADPEITRQFRQIVEFYRTKLTAQGSIKDPKVQKMMEMISENLNILEKKTGANAADVMKEEPAKSS